MEQELRPSSLAPRFAIATLWPIWFLAVFVLGAAGLLATPEHEPPLRILLGCIVPLGIFVVALTVWPAFRRTVLSTDARVMTAMQAWRAAGLTFIALYAQGILPGLFAWPAGLGDMAVGLTAPWVVAALVRDPGFVGSRKYVLWNLFGILDLIVAVATGTLSSGFVGRLAGSVTTAPMGKLPLVLIPTFFVPLLLMLHIVALLQARKARRLREGLSLG